jgi:hypothetical protein
VSNAWLGLAFFFFVVLPLSCCLFSTAYLSRTVVTQGYAPEPGVETYIVEIYCFSFVAGFVGQAVCNNKRAKP